MVKATSAGSDASRSDSLYLALDQGGHSSRAIVMDASGQVFAKAQIAVSTNRTGSYVEQDPLELITSLKHCCNSIAEQLGEDLERIQSAGLATQRSSIVCWDRSTGVAISPVLSWQDRRGFEFVESLEPYAERIKNVTGLVLTPHYGASKIRWCLQELEEVKREYGRGNLVIGPLASYLTRQLTGSDDNLCDPANASRTQLWDFSSRAWSEELCRLFDVDLTVLPKSVTTKYEFGDIRVGHQRVPLELVTGDQSAAIYAFGNPDSETLYINMGTGAFMQLPSGLSPRFAPGLLNSVAYQDADRTEYVMEGTVNGAGSALTWLAKQTGADPKVLVSQGLRELESASPPIFVNGISGLGSPFWEGSLESNFSQESPGGLKALAVLESIAFLVLENLERMRASGAKIDKILLSGGLSSVDYLCQTIAELSAASVERTSVKEASARGLVHLLKKQEVDFEATQSRGFELSENAGIQSRLLGWKAEMTRLLSS